MPSPIHDAPDRGTPPPDARAWCLRLTALVMTLGLSACSSDGNSDWSAVAQMVKGYWTGSDTVPIEQAAGIPYATVGVRVGDGAQGMFILASQTGNDLLWVSGRVVAFTTRDGRIIRSAGLDHNLAGYLPQGSMPAPETAASWSTPRAIAWTADLTEPDRYSVRVECQRQPEGIEAVTLLGKQIRTLKVTEDCSAPEIGWNFVNTFWVGPDNGFVWKSIQFIHPDLDPIEIETLRPPG
jgi:hypothetical protein